VRDLDHLPLGIDQAAAYIRESAKSFRRFVSDYVEYRRDVNDWQPQGIRQYPRTLAATWHLSFEVIRRSNPIAIELLHLLSFLNLDGISIEFLEAGKAGMAANLKALISHRVNFERAIIDLEKFSIIKRSGHKGVNEILVIHRLVQAVVQDETRKADLLAFRTTVLPSIP
jgi:hypothetical protein